MNAEIQILVINYSRI